MSEAEEGTALICSSLTNYNSLKWAVTRLQRSVARKSASFAVM